MLVHWGEVVMDQWYKMCDATEIMKICASVAKGGGEVVATVET